MKNLANKKVEIKGKRHYYSIVMDGTEYSFKSHGLEFSKLQEAILPTRSLLVTPGIYTLDENGKLPKEANNEMVVNFDDNGHTTYGPNEL